jgi:biotin carboxyl carrier protein
MIHVHDDADVQRETTLRDDGDVQTTTTIYAEDLHVPERLIAAPAAGVFRSVSDGVTAAGEIVHEGQVVGTIEVTGDTVPVTSPHAGHLMGLLAYPGERVRTAQPLAWIRVHP